MPTAAPSVSDMLITVKNRQIQQAMYAEIRGDQVAARRHFLAAGHLEAVLAEDYETAGDAENSQRSRISAASCLWKGGEAERGRAILDEMVEADPSMSGEVRRVLEELDETATRS